MRLCFALWMALCVVGCSRKEAEQGASEAVPVTDGTGAAAPPAPSPVDQVLALPSLKEAVDFSRPHMEDTQDETSKGAILLAAWSAKKLRWDELSAVGETRFALVRKEADLYRGQRLCTRGWIAQIQSERTDYGKLYVGQLVNSSQQVVRFLAVRSTGELVERSWGRFCGLVVGNYSYANAGGGTTHAVQLVGMFDLPENHL